VIDIGPWSEGTKRFVLRKSGTMGSAAGDELLVTGQEDGGDGYLSARSEKPTAGALKTKSEGGRDRR